MEWETVVYGGLSVLTVLVARRGPYRIARALATLLFLSCAYANIVWYLYHEVPTPQLAESALYIDAATAGLLTVIALYTPPPKRWLWALVGIAYWQFFATCGYYFLVEHPTKLTRWWYAAHANLTFTLACFTVMSPTLVMYYRKRKSS